jgi:anaerobic magnesium-protoporphyrin IX monomethyl ester cyclase
MKVVLISMPDVAAVIMHEAAFHMPDLDIASLAGNLDEGHEVYLIDLVRKRRSVRRYLSRILTKIQPDVVGLSSMTWQFGTCLKLVRMISGPASGFTACIRCCGRYWTVRSGGTAGSPSTAAPWRV